MNKIIYLVGAYQIVPPIYNVLLHQYNTRFKEEQKLPYKGTALVTGGSEGIGREFAEQIASHGYDVTITSRSLAKLEKVVAENKTK